MKAYVNRRPPWELKGCGYATPIFILHDLRAILEIKTILADLITYRFTHSVGLRPGGSFLATLLGFFRARRRTTSLFFAYPFMHPFRNLSEDISTMSY